MNRSKILTVFHITVLGWLLISLPLPTTAQKRGSKRRTGSPTARKPSTVRPRIAQPVKALPIVPEYEHDQYTGISRVDLKWSPVKEWSGANVVKLYVRYVYAKDWMQIGSQNDVLLAFSINAAKRICSDRCIYTLIIDGYEQPVSAESAITQMGDGTVNEFVSKWMSPKVFKKITEAQKMQVRMGSVSFSLSDQQIEGLRQIVPFLRFRPFFN